jgi:hypothetical protein
VLSYSWPRRYQEFYSRMSASDVLVYEFFHIELVSYRTSHCVRWLQVHWDPANLRCSNASRVWYIFCGMHQPQVAFSMLICASSYCPYLE